MVEEYELTPMSDPEMGVKKALPATISDDDTYNRLV